MVGYVVQRHVAGHSGDDRGIPLLTGGMTMLTCEMASELVVFGQDDVVDYLSSFGFISVDDGGYVYLTADSPYVKAERSRPPAYRMVGIPDKAGWSFTTWRNGVVYRTNDLVVAARSFVVAGEYKPTAPVGGAPWRQVEVRMEEEFGPYR